MARLRAFLEEQAIEGALLEMGRPLATVQAAAAHLGVHEDSIFKTLVLVDDKARALAAVLPGGSRLDLKGLARLRGCRKLRFATRDEALEATGYAVGGTAPLGHAFIVPVYVDEGALSFGDVYCGGGHPDWLLRIQARELLRATAGTLAALAVK